MYTNAMYEEAWVLYDRLLGAWLRESSIDTPRARRLERLGTRANKRRIRRLRQINAGMRPAARARR